MFPWYLVYVLTAIVPAVIVFGVLGLAFTPVSLVIFGVMAALLLMPILGTVLSIHCRLVAAKTPVDQKLISFKDASFASAWKGKKIPIETLYEAYFSEKLDIEGDLLEALYKRYDYSSMVVTLSHFKFFLFQLIPELLTHSRVQDTSQVRDHYDRGNDFYNAFLGETMVYTSGIFNDFEETLEQAQNNKLDLIMNKIHLKKGERLLDIGCGWGTLTVHAAKKYGADVTGVTLAKEQTEWANNQIQKAGVKQNARILCMDYRDIPRQQKFNKITCVEMAEHVGVKLFQSFMRQVYDMLEDDGVFYLQIAGLRRAFQYEDLVWGLFMGKYVFPGADASCPLAWVIHQAEGAGFEVHTVETVGIHYSATIKRWYDNWQKNKDYIVKKYGVHWFRKWSWFLAWSTIIAEQGSATCYQIVFHKNLRSFNRNRYIGERLKYKI
jgi:cyclopropane fatty-acyl-phospholipid synthase-like methyltransferase